MIEMSLQQDHSQRLTRWSGGGIADGRSSHRALYRRGVAILALFLMLSVGVPSTAAAQVPTVTSTRHERVRTPGEYAIVVSIPPSQSHNRSPSLPPTRCSATSRSDRLRCTSRSTLTSLTTATSCSRPARERQCTSLWLRRFSSRPPAPPARPGLPARPAPPVRAARPEWSISGRPTARTTRSSGPTSSTDRPEVRQTRSTGRQTTMARAAPAPCPQTPRTLRTPHSTAPATSRSRRSPALPGGTPRPHSTATEVLVRVREARGTDRGAGGSRAVCAVLAAWEQRHARPECWPNCGEIDVHEALGNLPLQADAFLHGPVPNQPGYQQWGSGIESALPLTSGFHTYGITWRPNKITWTIDGVPW